MPRIAWWEWPVVQCWYWRRYKRADRKAFARECAAIRWHHTMTGGT
jgi:hypothetical protein